jgi:hypothetical protein
MEDIFQWENEIGDVLNRIRSSDFNDHGILYGMDRIIDDDSCGYRLNNEQRDAFRKIIMSENLSILTGLPGTGKSSVIERLYKFYDMRGKRMIITAPTGCAISNIIQRIRPEIQKHTIGTIHKVFFNNVEMERPDVVIVDEASMIPYELFLTILKYTDQNQCKIILVGDPQQLHPIDVGQLFATLVKNDRIHQVYKQCIFNLRKVVRADCVPLYETIRDISCGEFDPGENFHDNCRFIKCDDGQIIELMDVWMKENGVTKDNSLILVGQNEGKFGMKRLNLYLQDFLGRRMEIDCIVSVIMSVRRWMEREPNRNIFMMFIWVIKF